jgi:hypothetical protein
MRILQQFLGIALTLVAPVLAAPQSAPPAPSIEPMARQLFALANQARGAEGAPPLAWDPALAAAAQMHCQMMAAEGPISHRYGGESGLAERAGAAGAHFSLIEENVALGPSAAVIHDGWMQSPGHRENLLNPQVDRAGIAVVSARGVFYAVADYERAVQVMTLAQVESAVGAQLRAGGLAILPDPTDARAACVLDRGLPRPLKGPEPGFVVRWQDANLTSLPQSLTAKLALRSYRQASVGSCPARDEAGAFTAYRLAVLLY